MTAIYLLTIARYIVELIGIYPEMDEKVYISISSGAKVMCALGDGE